MLTSDGTNWLSSAPSGSSVILSASGQLTSAQIKALHATPIQVIAAPGSGKMIVMINFFSSFVYGGTNPFTAGASQAVEFYYGTSTSSQSALTNVQLVGTSSGAKVISIPNLSFAATSTWDNKAINLYNSVATEITGNAANNNVLNYEVTYYIATF